MKLRRMLLLIGVTVLVAASLGSLYSLAPSNPPWLGPALINSLFAVGIAWTWRRERPAWLTVPRVEQQRLARTGWQGAGAYLFGAGVLAGTLALVSLSQFYGTPGRGTVATFEAIAIVAWIPLVEEVVFRVGVGGVLRRLGGDLWGGYFSALTFALAHSLPTVGRLLAGDVGVPVGPLALGLIAEYLYGKTGRLGPIVALHVACNASGPLFLALDARWLGWLDFLFL